MSSTSGRESQGFLSPLTLRDRIRYALHSAFTSFTGAYRVTQLDRDIVSADRENNSLSFVQAHLSHGIANMVMSLLGFGVLINSSWKLAFEMANFQQVSSTHTTSLANLSGEGPFAIALLSAGQSSSIIATVAGQAVSEGSLRWRVSPIVGSSLDLLRSSMR